MKVSQYYDYMEPGSFYRSSKGNGSNKKYKNRGKRDQRDKRVKTLWKRCNMATVGQTTPEYRRQRREINAARKRWISTLEEITQRGGAP